MNCDKEVYNYKVDDFKRFFVKVYLYSKTIVEMKTYLISYDLWWPENSSDYKTLIDKIKSYSNYSKPLESFWFIKTDDSLSTVRDNLKNYVDKNDKILVMNVSWTWWASYLLWKSTTDWMKENL